MANTNNVHVDRGVLTANFTRPANVTAYATGQIIGPTPAAIITFSKAARAPGGVIEILYAKVFTNAPSAAFGQASIIFFGTAPTAQADQATFDFAATGSYFEAALATGDSGTAASSRQNAYALAGPQLLLPDSNLYAVMVSRSAFTPTSGQVFRIEVSIERH